MTTVKVVICTLDNLPLLKEQILLLQADSCNSEIIVVNNGSVDGTREWLNTQNDLTIVNRDNKGAGPGRNAGLDAAGSFDYVLMLDGGIRPLRGGTQRMLDYLERRQDADVIGVEIPHFETDYDKAWRRWPRPITDSDIYVNSRLSHTAYCLSRAKAWDGLRFCEDGPFGEPGWGADDDEMAYQWNEVGISVHVVTNIHPYRRGSGSFRRLFLETGIWPDQYGSVYEKRLVYLQQNWPQYEPGVAWGEPWLTVVIQADAVRETAMLIKATHDELRKRRFDEPWSTAWNPYSIVVWCCNGHDEFLKWAEPRRLRQHHGQTNVVNGEIVHRDHSNELTWTGDFRIWNGEDWRDAVRENAHYYGFVRDGTEIIRLLEKYNSLYHPRQSTKNPPAVTRMQIHLEGGQNG